MTGNQLQSNILRELKWEPGLDASHVNVVAKDGAVVLSGHVPSFLARTRAVAATERVRGVKAVADELEVRLAGEHTRDDVDIAESIAHLLRWNTVLANQLIHAEVAKGVVTLTGVVGWNYQRQQAATAVSAVLGVQSVIDQITVKTDIAPEKVEEEITSALERRASLHAPEIHVDVSGTRVVLTGHVRSLDESRLARDVAWSAPGVTDVDDRLLIQA